MRAAAPDAAACDRCHAPLAAVLGDGSPLAGEGVTCEVCHSIPDVTLSAAPTAAPAWTLRLDDNRKYGPLCDAEPPYFHRAACSPLHAESRLCAACHHLSRVAEGGAALAVFSEFEEWQHGEAMSAGVQCQGCHMPPSRGLVASGGPTRAGLTQHGTAAAAPAVDLAAALVREDDALVAVATLRSGGVGHAVPVGLPGRQLVLRAALLDAAGQPLGAAEAVFSRVLVDAAGREVPFFAAVRQAEDTRLQAGESREVRLRLPRAPGAATVELELLDRPLSPALAHALGVAVEARPRRSLKLDVGGAR